MNLTPHSEVIKFLPKEFQKVGISFPLRYGYTINAAKPGSGKTFMSVSCCLMRGGKTLIICPAYLKFNWLSEIDKFTKYETFSLVITKPTDLYKIQAAHDFVIISYEMSKYVLKLKLRFDNVIIDECHYLKNRTSKRFKIVYTYIKTFKPEFLNLLSGTPITRGVIDWYSLLMIMSLGDNNGLKLNLKFNDFMERYTNIFTIRHKVRLKSGKEIEREEPKYSGVKNFAELMRLLDKKLINIKPPQGELPELFKHEIMMGVDLKGRDKLLLDAFEDGVEDDHITTIKKESAMIKAEWTLKYLLDLIQSCDSPIIVFSDHVAPIDFLRDKLSSKNYKVARINGNVEFTERQKIVDRLQAGELDFLLATIKSANTGYNMTKASEVVFNDLSWDETQNEQAWHRAYRLGQINTTNIRVLNATSVDARINNNLMSKSRELRRFQ